MNNTDNSQNGSNQPISNKLKDKLAKIVRALARKVMMPNFALEAEQHHAELAIMHTIQTAMASKLDFQGVIDAVGDQIRHIFPDGDAGIGLVDRAQGMVHIMYMIEKGERYPNADYPLGQGLTHIILNSGKPLVINSDAVRKTAELGAVYPGIQVSPKSWLGIPIVADHNILGIIVLQDFEHEYAYPQAKVELLQTAATGLGVALENARLFDETQRLLKVIDERAAQLTFINSVQEGLANTLASKVDIQAIYDLVGDKIRDLFNAQAILIITFDPVTRTRRSKYHFEKGQRHYTDELFSFNKLTEDLIATKRPLVFNEEADARIAEYGMVPVAGTELFKSAVFVPMIAGTEVKGHISLQNVEQENAFSESDINLLSTLASSITVALENALLFDETQRLLKVTEQRAAELAIINSVQEGLASKLDMQAIYDLVGDKIRDLFNAQAILILTIDPLTRTRHVKYHFEKGQRFYAAEALPFNKFAEYLVATKKPFVINQGAEAIFAEFGMVRVAGTEFLKSAVFVPLIADGEVKGLITLQNVEQENAFSESDINLLSTLASSITVALENARLFDEIQRLLKVTEQRAAELAIINSVQEGLASKLDMQAIYDLVGDKIRDLFNAQTILILAFDPLTRTRQVKYNFEKGQRFQISELYPFNKLTEHLIATKETLVFNQNAEDRIAEYGMVQVTGTEVFKSAIYVPLIAGSEVNGLISLQNLEQENAFSESDIDLLSTFASSMSVALENARLYEEQLLVAEELKRVDRMKSQFLSSMSHELRTPLNAIINFVEMIAEGMIGPVNEEQKELLDSVSNSSNHLLHLINDVLDISKIQAGRLTLLLEDQVNVQEEIQTTIAMVDSLIKNGPIRLIQDVDDNLPIISGDSRRIRQVILNLLSNAIKFTEHGIITLSAKILNNNIIIAVIDTGQGISKEAQEMIFEPFVQTADGIKVGGTGLGLPISRSLVRAHGGDLWVESEPGEGAAFYFTLPIQGAKSS